MKLTNKFIKEFFSYKRPHASTTEQDWIERYILPELGDAWWQDDAGNIHYDNRQDTGSRTLFTAHTDTVHPKAGRQKVAVFKDNTVHVDGGECLGADDGAGVLVLLSLIKANVPAYYVLTRCEERGGVGAKHLADTYPNLLSQFDRAIAFDRKGTSSVITHQGWGRCCSDAFADALSNALSSDELMYAPDDTGVYTDTAEFIGSIPECTNISVGYMNEHRPNETLDLVHLKALIRMVISIDWESLPTDRDPSVPDPDDLYDPHYYKWDAKYDDGYTHYNVQVFDACVDAIGGDTGELLYHIACVVNPAEPDEMYALIWDMPLPMDLLNQCRKDIDFAVNDDAVEQALYDLYQDAIAVNTYH